MPDITSPSVLFDRERGGAPALETGEPAFFGDLNLDQVRDALIAGREEYDLAAYFHTPLHEVAAVRYRHAALRDLEHAPLRESVLRFAEGMRTMRERIALAAKLHYVHQRERWFLDAVEAYCSAVSRLAAELAAMDLGSNAFRALRDHLTQHTASAPFTTLTAGLQNLRDELAGVTYSVHINGARVTVSRYEGESDYSGEVHETFAKFEQGAVKDYRVAFRSYAEMDQVEERVLNLVVRLYPEVFLRLAAYCAEHRDFVAPAIGRFDREVQFYLAYLELVDRLESAGLSFCYPEVSTESKQIHAEDAFDVALAGVLAAGSRPVPNSFSLGDPERIVVVTGPNQGGKTTFARMFGQLHYLGGLGYPVPGTDAALFLPDRVFTHFEREEDPTTFRGKLEDELVRIHEILEHATADSIVIMNESFSSTALQDAVFLGREVLTRLVALDALAVCVTFIDELASVGPATVSMVTAVQPDDPAVRTFRIVRRPADGLAYAAAIAEKYGLTYDRLRTRIAG